MKSLDVVEDSKTVCDKATADAFATSWNNLPEGSIYTRDQFEDWMLPLTKKDVIGKRVLELGCGNASLMVHMADWKPALLEGVDLGDSVLSAEKNLASNSFRKWKVVKGDLVEFQSDGFDLVYCIGVLHHLKEPEKGFQSVVRNTRPGGRFHCWVYAREGNAPVIFIVDPIRKIVSHLPWWFTKYFVAAPLSVPFYFYAKILAALPRGGFASRLPMHSYMIWISKREFAFFRHIAFDQLVTPQTTYLSRSVLEKWLASDPKIDPASTYMIKRNGNSWKFGGMIWPSGVLPSGLIQSQRPKNDMKKLNLGSGKEKKEGYVNIDWQELYSPDLSLDLNVFPYPFADGEFEHIEAFHVLEHLDKPFRVMTELRRILAAGGKLHIKVPHFSRAMTHAEHCHGFDVTFPYYFDKRYIRWGYFGTDLELEKMELHWMAFFHLLRTLGYGSIPLFFLWIADRSISFLANLSPSFCSRIWCYWVGGFEEIEYVFKK